MRRPKRTASPAGSARIRQPVRPRPQWRGSGPARTSRRRRRRQPDLDGQRPPTRARAACAAGLRARRCDDRCARSPAASAPRSTEGQDWSSTAHGRARHADRRPGQRSHEPPRQSARSAAPPVSCPVPRRCQSDAARCCRGGTASDPPAAPAPPVPRACPARATSRSAGSSAPGHRRDEHVARAADGLDHRRAVVGRLDLAAEPAHHHVHRAVDADRGPAAREVEQLVA